jgi:putative membrane protein
VAVVAVVCAPPLGERLEERMATHMVQHVVLIVVAAPLIALATPGQVLLAGLPRTLRRGLVRTVRRVPAGTLLTPHAAWALQTAALWCWHLPVPYDAAVRNETTHLSEHAVFLGTAWLFWWHLVRLGRHRLRGAGAFLYVALAIPPGAALGAVLTFADHPLYPAQVALARTFGSTDPLFDQRLAALVMWIPLDFAYLALAIWIFHRWWQRQAPHETPDLVHVLPVDSRTAEVRS